MARRARHCTACPKDCRRHLRWPTAIPVQIRFPYHERVGATVNLSAAGMQLLVPSIPADAGPLANVTLAVGEAFLDFDAALVFRSDEGELCRLGLTVEGADRRAKEWLADRHPSI